MWMSRQTASMWAAGRYHQPRATSWWEAATRTGFGRTNAEVVSRPRCGPDPRAAHDVRVVLVASHDRLRVRSPRTRPRRAKLMALGLPSTPCCWSSISKRRTCRRRPWLPRRRRDRQRPAATECKAVASGVTTSRARAGETPCNDRGQLCAAGRQRCVDIAAGSRRRACRHYSSDLLSGGRRPRPRTSIWWLASSSPEVAHVRVNCELRSLAPSRSTATRRRPPRATGSTSPS